jgi:hypothetical protein
MLAILFPHLFEDDEYLLPQDVVLSSQESQPSQATVRVRQSRPVQVNAVASSSRQ